MSYAFNPKQIDKTSKTLLDLRARCVGERIKLQEAKSNPETNSVKGQVSNARGKHILGFWKGDQIMPYLINGVKKNLL